MRKVQGKDKGRRVQGQGRQNQVQEMRFKIAEAQEQGVQKIVISFFNNL